jgi:CRISPR-associated protein Cas2
MLIVVSYDVPDDRRRTKLAHALKDFGGRVQYSVFECLLEPDQVEALRLRIGRLIAPEEDRVRIYRFCTDCGSRTEILGLGKLTEDPDVYVL